MIRPVSLTEALRKYGAGGWIGLAPSSASSSSFFFIRRDKDGEEEKDEEALFLMERETLLDPRDHRLVDLAVFAELPLALRALAGGKVA
jgi:hypothetical protein